MNAKLIMIAGVTPLLLSCSMLVDTSVTQCNTNADCVALGGGSVRAVCSAEKMCVRPECTVNADCTTAGGGAPAICRKVDQKCAPLTSAECVTKAAPADIVNDETLWFGLLSPRMTGAHMEAAADLVRQSFAQSQLPPAVPNGPRRPFGFVSCTNDSNGLEKSLNHLLNVVQVPAILGSNLSSDIVTMLNNYTLKSNVLTLAPTASSPLISDIDNKGLFFRMSGSDTIAVKTLAFVLRTVIEPQLRAGMTPVLGPGEPMRVAVLYKGDALGSSNNNAATRFVTFNGGKGTTANGSNYKAINYGGDSNDPTAGSRYESVIRDVVNFKPHAIFGFGSLEFSNVDVGIEKAWPQGVPRPYWLVVKGIATTFITDVGTDEGWARRIYGAQPFVDKSTDAYKVFDQNFRDAYPMLGAQASVTATPSYFDASYVLAYGVVANGARPLTGANLANAIRTRLTPGPNARTIFVGYDKIFEVFGALDRGERVDLQGLTGSLDFDDHGDVPQTQEVFCMKTEPSPTGGFGKVTGVKSAGMIYDSVSDTVVGNITSCPGP
jgi:ABC-type branched-subunit amino acid transport system substrate-binding protein